MGRCQPIPKILATPSTTSIGIVAGLLLVSFEPDDFEVSEDLGLSEDLEPDPLLLLPLMCPPGESGDPS